MGNNYFQFKQFTVQQGDAAMKVCTDSCLFGAIIAAKYPANRVLDIGTGTGLLSLMYAQKNPNAFISAIEIESKAAAQAQGNISQSKWSASIAIQNISLQEYAPVESFDLIISNPPFFENDLKSVQKNRNMAMHSSEMTIADIFHFSKENLTVNGTLALLIPFSRMSEVETLAKENGFFLSEKIFVRQTPRHSFFRSILFLKKGQFTITNTEITIRKEDNNYTEAFSKYLSDYYLYL